MSAYTETKKRSSAKPIYIVSDVARFSRASTSKISRWLEGYAVSGHEYEPFLQTPPERCRDRPALTFENLIEVSLVTELRRRGISLQTIRQAHKIAGEEFGTYPFARRQIFVSGKDIFMEASEYVRKEAEHLATLTRGGQRASELILSKYLTQIDWRDGWPAEWHPWESVGLNPEAVFGLPSVKGVRTEILRNRFLANESAEFIAEDLSLIHISEPTRLRRISYAVFCLKKKKK